MTSTLAQGVGRSPGEPVRPLRALALSPALIVLLLGGLALRLTIAYVLFPASGFESDLASYASWAGSMAEYGPGGFYENAGFADYPPAYLYVLWAIGLLAGAGGEAGELIKLPPMLLDLAVGYVIYRLVRGWTWPGARSERPGARCRRALPLQPRLALRLGAVGPDRRGRRAGAAAGSRRPHPRQQRRRRRAGRDRRPGQAAVRRRAHPARGVRARQATPAATGLRTTPSPVGAAAAGRLAGPRAGLAAAADGLRRRLGRPSSCWRCPSAWAPSSTSSACSAPPAATPTSRVNAFNLWALLGADGPPSLAAALTLVRRHQPAAGAAPGRRHRCGAAGGGLPVGRRARRGS